jgi:hypothetical protein
MKKADNTELKKGSLDATMAFIGGLDSSQVNNNLLTAQRNSIQNPTVAESTVSNPQKGSITQAEAQKANINSGAKKQNEKAENLSDARDIDKNKNSQKSNPNKMEKKDTPQRKSATGQNGSSGSSYNTNVKTSFGKVQPATPQRKAVSTTPKNNTATPTRKGGTESAKSTSQSKFNTFKENSSSTTSQSKSSGSGGQPTPKPPTNSKSPSKGPTR